MLDSDALVLVDLSRPEVYARLHAPGAIPLAYAELVLGVAPAPGLPPPVERLNDLARRLGIHAHSVVVAYDDEGGGRACRLVWTLHAMGFRAAGVVNGGLHAWSNEGHRVTVEPRPEPGGGTFRSAAFEASVVASKDYVLARVNDRASQLLDSRTPEEYAGTRVLAARGGHIPGAVNLNWTDAMDRSRNLRLKSDGELQRLIEERGLSLEREFIAYCQTHHRSSHAYLMLRHLGCERVRGYAGAWSEWGNDPSLPIET